MRDYAELARLGGVSRARMTQIMSLRNLAPVIQERILGLPAVSATAEVLNEHVLRGVAQRWDWREQMRMWKQLEGTLEKSAEVLREERTAYRGELDVAGSTSLLVATGAVTVR